MASIGNALKGSTAVSVTAATAATASYTAPSTGYAIVHVWYATIAPTSMTLGGYAVPPAFVGVNPSAEIYLGASQNISVVAGGGSGVVYITGTSFVNS